MSLFAKPPVLVMLTAVLWLTAVDLASAQTSNKQREHFAALVANPQNPAIANFFQQQITLLNGQAAQLQQQQQNIGAASVKPPLPPSLVRINTLDQRLTSQSTRILERLQKLNNQAISGFSNSTALNRLRNDLNRQEAVIGRQIQTLRRLERSAATPSAPGGF